MRLLTPGNQPPIDLFLDGVNISDDTIEAGVHDEQGAACHGWARVIARDPESGEALFARDGALSMRLLTGEVVWYWLHGDEVIH